MKPLIACAIMLCIALPLQAQTYKWVDEKGVTNYSSEPPPAKKGSSVKVVEDRLSIVEKDPALDKAAEELRQREAKRAEYAEAAYARRQQQPAPQPATNDIYSECPYGSDCSGYGYYPGYGYYDGYGPSWRRAAFVHGRQGHRPAHPIAGHQSRPARTVPHPLLDAPRAARPSR